MEKIHLRIGRSWEDKKSENSWREKDAIAYMCIQIQLLHVESIDLTVCTRYLHPSMRISETAYLKVIKHQIAAGDDRLRRT